MWAKLDALGVGAVTYVLAGLLVLLAVGPALWLVNISLQPRQLGLDQLTPPGKWTLVNYAAALDVGLLTPFVNSVIVTSAQTLLNVLLAATCAYPLARMNFFGKNILFILLLGTLMVPEQVITIPLYVTVIDLGLADTLVGVVLPFAVSAFGIYLCRQAFLSVPLELEEAARIDGANALQTWWHVMLPLIRPTLATLAVFSMIGAWSNLLWPLIVLQSESKQTLPVAINQLLSVHVDNIRYAYAAAVLALIPMILGYIFAQRWLERGMLAGAVKG
jgi:putative chitobiose transport system permease protein